MGLSLPHLLIVLIIVLILFGRGKIAPLMKELGSGVKNFKDGMNEESAPVATKKPTAKKPAAKKAAAKKPAAKKKKK